MNEPNSPREAFEQLAQERAQNDLRGAQSLLAVAMTEIKGIPGIKGIPATPQTVRMGEPSAIKFRVGDVVVLRSGGPRMTVYFMPIAYGRASQIVKTEWFNGGELKRDEFSEAELEPAPPKETS